MLVIFADMAVVCMQCEADLMTPLVQILRWQVTEMAKFDRNGEMRFES
jgi:hypothetical protein